MIHEKTCLLHVGENAADQHLCFRYVHVDRTIPLLPNSEI